MTLVLRCANEGCGEVPVLAAVRVSPDDIIASGGTGTLYEMFATCAAHEQAFIALRPSDLGPHAFIRFEQVPS